VFIRLLIISISLFFIQSCGTGVGKDNQKNLAELDKIYGKCDNPLRTYRPLEYKICKDKERAAGPDGEIGEAFNITEAFESFNNPQAVAVADTNSFLWDASLNVLNAYAIKISDFEGGYIETDWIKQSSTPDERCIIKTHITSRELVSNGVKVSFICEEKVNGEWYLLNEKYIDQEKQLTLKILTEAANQLNSSSAS
jgi:hypothetical protein